MCGIAGIVQWRQKYSHAELANIVTKMANSMTHRGPDDLGHWISPSGNCALAHRRLSILDLTANGRQPMSNDKRDTWVTFNGEIYNYGLLKKQLEKSGTVFSSTSDTEVLPNLFEDMRYQHLEQIDGMYAFGIWNEKKRKLLLARDPFGKKPLYYSVGDGWIAFVSELQALAAIPSFDSTLNPDAIQAYLLLQYVPSPQTIYKNANKLPPGSVMQVQLHPQGEPAMEIKRFYGFRPDEKRAHDEETNATKNKLKGLLITAVEKRLISDVPVGAFLSGGVDSSLVTAIIRKELNRPIKTFSVGFEGTAESEHLDARCTAEFLGTEHHETLISSASHTSVDEIAYRLDEPNGDSSCLPTLRISESAKRHVSVILSGDGGDELFGGYGRYRDTLNENMVYLSSSDRQGNGLTSWSPSGAYLSHRWLIFTQKQVEAMTGKPLHAALSEQITQWTTLLESPRLSLMGRMRTLDAETYLPGAVLAKVDRMSMQNSLEVRCPLLDRSIAGFAVGLTEKDCWIAPNRTKALLKEIASDYLPKEWVERRKMGFGLPTQLQKNPELRSMTVNRLLETKSLFHEFVSKRTLQENFGVSLEKMSIYQVWPLLVLESWLRQKAT